MLTTNYQFHLLSDKELCELVKQDCDKAFQEIYSRYWNFLTISAAKHLQCTQKAEDIVQEIFISFYNRRDSIEFSVSLRAYLCKALKFKIMNEFRSKAVRAAYQKTIYYIHTGSARTNFFCAYEYKELAQSISHSVSLLPEKCRQAFLLSRAEDLSYKDISGHLGISVSTVEKHISKALKFLKLDLNVDGFNKN